MTIEKAIIVAIAIAAIAYFSAPIALEAYKMKQCTDSGTEADSCFVLMHRKF